MNSIGKHLFFAAALTMATQAIAQQITFFGREAYQGNSITTDRGIGNLQRSGLNERASSAVVSGSWEVCNGPDFTGQCFVLAPGEYPSLRDVGLTEGASSARMADGNTVMLDPRGPQIVFYDQPGFQGRSFGSYTPIPDLKRVGPNRAASVVVEAGAWEVCDGERFSGRCVLLRPGRYPSFGVIGLEGPIASVRLAG
jgi:hypothetical protein